MTRSLGTAVSKEFRDSLQIRYPNVFKSPHKIAFLKHTLYLPSIVLDGEYSVRLISCNYVKEFILGLEKESRFGVGKFLDDFQKDIDFPLNVIEYEFTKNLAREFDPELPDNLRDMVMTELEIPKRKKVNPVYFLDGTVWSARKDSTNRHVMHENHYRDNPGGVILNYHSNQNPVIYNKYTEKIDAVIEELILDKPYMDSREYETYLKVFSRMSETLEPFYFQRATHERVWASGYSIQNIPAKYRRLILTGTVEIDMVNAHLSILAYKWPIPGAISLLESGVNTWQYFHTQLGLEFTPETKAGFKKGLYTILYAGGLDEIRKQMKLHGIKSDTTIDRFLDLPLILEIRAAAKAQSKIATDNRYVTLADGSKLTTRRKEKNIKAIKPHGLPSHAAISYERALIETIYEIAEKYPKDFRIISLEHDGLSYEILDKTKESAIFKRLKKAVESKGKEFGIKISLEQK